jgi:hypothetical protein
MTQLLYNVEGSESIEIMKPFATTPSFVARAITSHSQRIELIPNPRYAQAPAQEGSGR